MRVAYVDTSFIVAVALGEPNSDALTATLMTFERVTSAALMEAELRATLDT
ncbi:MAG: hypothetical protein P3A28_07325 [Gemmatimonadota bacterium]|nr:hypothetical protein [Gemmatimonadota bacterium]